MSYKEILDRADAFFRSASESQRQNLQCGRGCSLCCYGLFEFGAADIPVLAEGLERLHPMRRRKIVRKALAIVAESRHPNLRESTPVEKDEFFSRTASVACPNLNDSGECMIYDHRPLVCRTFGLPLRDGDRYIGDVCDLNFTRRNRPATARRCVGSAVGGRARSRRRVHHPGSDRPYRANARLDVTAFTFFSAERHNNQRSSHGTDFLPLLRREK